MILYGSAMSPFVRKVLVFAAEKAMPIDNVPVLFGAKEPAFIAASPLGKIPALVDGDFQLADSSAIVTYLEALQPDPALIPAEPRARARTIWFEEFVDSTMIAAGARIFFNRFVAPRMLGRPGDLAVADKAEKEELPPLLAYLETQIPASGFLVEDRLTLADIAVASPFPNLSYVDVTIDPATYPRLAAYVAAILARPSFAPLLAADQVQMAGAGPRNR